MNVLFIHQNYPAQFGRLARALVERDGCTVVAVGCGPRREDEVAPARYHFYNAPPQTGEARFPPLESLAEEVRRGRAVADVLAMLKRRGFHPDIVFGHPAWGETTFLRDIYPDARFGASAEFFYRARASDVDFDPEVPVPEVDLRYLRLRNVPMLLALESADLCIAPTAWQASTFPERLRPLLTVLHDGIDADPGPDAGATVTLPGGRVLSRESEVVTYVARNLEPYRGFHVVMRALPDRRRRRPRAEVVIVGGDEVSYGRQPAGGGSWRERMLKEVGAGIDRGRVHFLGRVPYETYRRVLQVSSVHVYLTYPFVLSWSLLEAMATGCAIVGSATGPVTEVIADGVNGRLVDFFDGQALAGRVAELLADPAARARLGEAARRDALAGFDFDRVTYPALKDVLGVVPSSRARAV